MDVQIIVPEVKMDTLANHLISLTEVINNLDADLVAHGCLGGEFGYGAEYENEVFEMRPFYWGDCNCGFEEIADKFWDKNEHAENCYQSKLKKVEMTYGVHWSQDRDISYDIRMELQDEIYSTLMAEFNLPRGGCAVHCTCGLKERAQKEIPEHFKICSLELPNFRHKESGIEVRWYKYIGRDMEVDGKADLDEIFSACKASLKPTD